MLLFKINDSRILLIMVDFLFLNDKVLLVYFAGTKRLFSYVQQVEKAHKGCTSSQKNLNYKQCLCRAAYSISGKKSLIFPEAFVKSYSIFPVILITLN